MCVSDLIWSSAVVIPEKYTTESSKERGAGGGGYLYLPARAAKGVCRPFGYLGSLGIHRQSFRIVRSLDLGVVHRAHDPRALEQIPQHLGVILPCNDTPRHQQLALIPLPPPVQTNLKPYCGCSVCKKACSLVSSHECSESLA
jgi:hypothetical protein